MKTRSIFILLFCIFCVSVKSFAQDVDSIIVQHTDKKGEVNVDSVLQSANYLLYSNPEQAMKLTRQINSIAAKQRDPIQLAHTFQFLGICFSAVEANYDSAFHYFDRAEQLYKENPSDAATLGMGRIMHNSGTIREIQGDYLQAIEFYIKALELFDKINDMKTRPYTLNNLATLYSTFTMYEKAEKYARECINLAEKSGKRSFAGNRKSEFNRYFDAKRRARKSISLF